MYISVEHCPLFQTHDFEYRDSMAKHFCMALRDNGVWLFTMVNIVQSLKIPCIVFTYCYPLHRHFMENEDYNNYESLISPAKAKH